MTDPAVTQLCERMARIRMRAHGKAARLTEETKQFLDWKHYIRLFPWTTIVAAGVLGYLVVPRRLPPAPLDRDALYKLADEQRKAREAAERHKPPSLLSSAISSGLNLALRAGLAYAGQQLMSRLVEPPASPESLRQESAYVPPRRPTRAGY